MQSNPPTPTTTDTRSCAIQIHEVAARRFCLVAADHPLVSAISENAWVYATKPHPSLHTDLSRCVSPGRSSRWEKSR